MILFNNISQSGLCDKFVDLILQSAYCHFKKETGYILKSNFNNVDQSKKGIYHPNRYQDVLIDNITEYINLPYNIIFTSDIPNNNIIKFDKYLGGCTPIISTFYTNYLKEDCSLDEYLNFIKNKSFSFKISPTFDTSNKTIGLHLRRTDKISQTPDYGQINSQQCNILNENTKQACDTLIIRGYTSFYIASDDEECLELFKNYLISKQCKVFYTDEKSYIKTYIDLCNLSSCDSIIMSSNHSNFSIIPSLIGNKKIISMFDFNNSMTKMVEWDSIIDFIPYTNLDITKIVMLGHQGVADFYSQVGLYNSIISKYFQLDESLILVESESNKKMSEHLFLNCKIDVANTTNEYNGIDTCLICHTTCRKNNCLRDNSKQPKFLDRKYYEGNNYKIHLLNSFYEYRKWEEFRKNMSFNVAFYLYNNINKLNLISRFDIVLPPQINIPDKEYIIYHDDPYRNIHINKNYFSKSINLYINLNQKSEIMIDCIELIKNAKEIHIVDSNYSVLIWLLCHKYNFCRNIPIYLHTYPRPGRELNIYTHNLPKNWKLI
jgi:hypothetical protein